MTAALALVALAPATAVAALPDLVADPPGAPYLQEWDLEGSTHRLLRFDGYIRNAGDGPVQIDGTTRQGNVMTAVTQRTFDPIADLESPALLIYEENDGHKHWHLRHAARYSLWDEAGVAEVAPASKIGFCLVDSDDVDEVGAGAYFDTCAKEQPLADSVTMGLSPGWRDRYPSNLWMQWVDVSSVAPGRYELRAEVDPDDVVVEADEVNLPADTPFTVPGYTPRAATEPLAPSGSATVRLVAEAHGAGLDPPQFRIDEAPARGTLDRPAGVWFDGPTISYTSAPGATVADDGFTFSVRERDARFPRSPGRAGVTLDAEDAPRVGEPVVISGAPREMIAGTSVRLTAAVPGVRWSATSGRVSTAGVYEAPLQPTVVVVRATAPSGAFGEAAIRIVAAAPRKPVPTACARAGGTSVRSAIGRLCARRAGGAVLVSAVPARGGRMRVTLLRRGVALRRCAWRVRAGRRYGCRFRVRRAPRTSVTITLRKRDGTLLSRRLAVR